MNKFVAIIIAVLAVICYVECGSEKSSLVKQLDDHVQFETKVEEPMEVILTGLRFINPLVEGPRKAAKKPILGFFGGKTVEERPQDLRRYLNEMKYILTSNKDQLVCTVDSVNEFFKINTDLYEKVEKGGKLHSAIAKYVEIMYEACSRDFQKVLRFDSPEDVDNFIKVLSDRAPKICGDVSRDNESWQYECATKLETLDQKETAKIVLDIIKEKSDSAQLSKDTDTADLKSTVRRRIGGYINSAVVGKCHNWYTRRLSYRGDVEVIGINKTIRYWTRFAEIAGVKQVDDIVKARGRSGVCEYIGSEKIFAEVTDAAYGQIPAPKK